MSSLGCSRAAAIKMPDNPAKYRVLAPAGSCCSKDWDVSESVEFGSSVGMSVDFISFEI